MEDIHFYEPKDGHRLPHDPFKAVVAPRPIGWISTVDAEGRPNLAPYSFFNGFCESPPVVGFSSSGRKDSQRNAEETGEFVANLATRIDPDLRYPPYGSQKALRELVAS
jgi:flavin reductase (DIM6/NTAB) family NADH-FMN oxidoreductase RutF